MVCLYIWFLLVNWLLSSTFQVLFFSERWNVRLEDGVKKVIWKIIILRKLVYNRKLRASLIAQLVKNPPAMKETPVWFLGWEHPLEKGYATHSSILGLSWWLSWQRICLQGGRPGFNPWVGKIPWRRDQLPAPVFWPGELLGLYSTWGHKESDTTEWLSLSENSD